MLPVFRHIGQAEYQTDSDPHVVDQARVDLIVHMALYHTLCGRSHFIDINIGQIALPDELTAFSDIAAHRNAKPVAERHAEFPEPVTVSHGDMMNGIPAAEQHILQNFSGLPVTLHPCIAHCPKKSVHPLIPT